MVMIISAVMVKVHHLPRDCAGYGSGRHPWGVTALQCQRNCPEHPLRLRSMMENAERIGQPAFVRGPKQGQSGYP